MIRKRLADNELDLNSFSAIAELAYRESGLQLVEEKASMIQSRLRHRLSVVGLDSFKSYAEYVCSNDGRSERIQMISALTTNVSHFFRENHHFDILKDRVVRPNLDRYAEGERLRIWSAGCSNGQEPLSIVMSILEAFPHSSAFDFKVLATDIDPGVVRFASQAAYPERFLSGVPDNLLQKYFTKIETAEGPGHKANEELTSRVVYRELNLLEKWPMSGLMDAIFCRNVVIYFDQRTQGALWPRFRTQLQPTGCLFVGHSERISDPTNSGFDADGPTTYVPI